MVVLKDLKAKHIHFVGIKGVGMTSLALCASDLGIKVTGSDVEEVFVTDEILKKRKIRWKVGFSQDNLNPPPDLVVTTGAHGGLSNPEVVAAKKMGIPAITLSEAQGLFAKDKETIAVCGVGGKTTTASMIATILDYAGLHPSFAIGVGNIFPLGTPGRFDTHGRYFILEADEFAISPGIDNRPRWTFLSPRILVVTNIEHDHPDIYPTFEDTKRVFHQFASRVPESGKVIVCSDNKNNTTVLQGISILTYGFGKEASYRIGKVKYSLEASKFTITTPEGERYDLTLYVPGMFNVLNATAAFVVAKHLGIKDKEILEGIASYRGCRRRIEKVGDKNGILVYDDYAHHPKEVRAVLQALKQYYPERRLLAIFQPHTYSRTKAFFADFAKSFQDADIVFLMDIYASAREKDTQDINSKLLARETAKYHKKVFYNGDHKHTLSKVLSEAKRGDVIVSLGAGNVFWLDEDLLKNL